MATRKVNYSGASLPFAALQLLAPPVRVVSAAVWKVMKQRDVLQYGVVEEFITSACDTVPGLLTVRHQGKLTLGLRARLILELCHTQPDIKMVEPHLKRIHASDPSSSSTAAKDLKVIKAANKFDSLVHTLLTNPAKREQFFKEEFPVEYGPRFDQELEKLLWEFLIRLDQLLPVPNLAQTVSWLSDAPPVLEACARAATQPQLLKILLQHQSCLGHLEPAASLPPTMGDTILDSLSLPLSGRVAPDKLTETKMSAVNRSDGSQTRDNIPVIARVASSNDATNMSMDTKKNLKFTVMKQMQKSKDDEENEGEKQLQEEPRTSKRNIRKKRKHPDERQSESEKEEEQEVLGMTRSGKTRMREVRSDQRTNRSKAEATVINEERNTKVLTTCTSQLGAKPLHLPEDPSLSSVYLSCLNSQPRVIVEKLSLASSGALWTGARGQSSHTEQRKERRKSPVKTPRKTTSNQHQDPDLDLDDKENHPVLPGISSSPSQQQRNPETLALSVDGEDYVADSEDEVTKNFKGRLFLKRYYKTKHGTYVPTLREFWKPVMRQLNLLSVHTDK